MSETVEQDALLRKCFTRENVKLTLELFSAFEKFFVIVRAKRLKSSTESSESGTYEYYGISMKYETQLEAIMVHKKVETIIVRNHYSDCTHEVPASNLFTIPWEDIEKDSNKIFQWQSTKNTIFFDVLIRMADEEE